MRTKPKKTIIILDGESDGYEEVSMKLMDEALCDPKIRELFEELSDNDEMGRRQLFATAFAFGVTAAVDAMRAGKIKAFPRG